MIHMLKERKGNAVTTRCLLNIKMSSGQSLPDVHVTGWEKQVTCPKCVLPPRPAKSGMVMDQEALLNGTGRWGEGYPSVTDDRVSPEQRRMLDAFRAEKADGYPSVTDEP